MRILLCEDEPTICEQVKRLLTAEGRIVDVAQDGQEACFLGLTEPYDMIILDLGLPMLDGKSVLMEWRSKNIDVPVLILSARDSWSDRVDGLDAGADDYMTKPFNLLELAARVRATLRRKSGRSSPFFEKNGVVLDTRNSRVTLDGVPVDLTALEIAVLSYLFHGAGRLISRTELSEHIYSHDSDRDSNTIAVFINRLRNKLGRDLIQTVRGRGYIIKVD